MARIRTIKPDLPQDATLARVSRITRLHFVYLLTVADDEGYFRATPRVLLGQLYPHDRDLGEAAVDRMTAELVEIGRIELFQTPDGPVGRFLNWKRHQKIDRPSSSHLAHLVKTSLARPSRVTREGSAPGVLSLESLVLSPETAAAARAKDAAPSTGTPDAVPVAETLVQTVAPSKADDYTLACVVALNGAVERVAPSVRAVRTDQERERGIAAAWAAEGVPLALATDVIVAKVAGCDRRNPPRSLRYFDGAVREAFERTRATGGPEDQAPRVVAYANLRWRADQLLNDGRRRLVARALESFGGELSALLYAVDGLAGSAWHEKANKRTLETCFGSFGEAERFAHAGGWTPGKAHAYATAPIEGRAA